MTWYVQCTYCKITNMGHETELLDKARKLCKNHKTNHFLDYVTAELDTLDHAILTPTSEIEILTQIHNSLPCSCLTDLTQQIEDRTQAHQLTGNTHNVTIPAAYAVPAIPQSSTKPTTRTTPKKPAKTLLERLKNGSNGTHQPRKI